MGSDIFGGEPRKDPCEGGVAATAVYSTVPSSPSDGLGAFPPEVMGKLMVTLSKNVSLRVSRYTSNEFFMAISATP